jgi:hypothetical protein
MNERVVDPHREPERNSSSATEEGHASGASEAHLSDDDALAPGRWPSEE